MRLSFAACLLSTLPLLTDATAVRRGAARPRQRDLSLGGLGGISISLGVGLPPYGSGIFPTQLPLPTGTSPPGIIISPGGLSAIDQALQDIISALQSLADIINNILAQFQITARSPTKRQTPAANLDAGFAAVLNALTSGTNNINGIQGSLTLDQATSLLADQVGVQNSINAFVNVLINNQGVFVQACLGVDIEAQAAQLLTATTNLQAAINAKISPVNLQLLGFNIQPTLDLITQLVNLYAGQALPASCTASSTSSTVSSTSSTTAVSSSTSTTAVSSSASSSMSTSTTSGTVSSSTSNTASSSSMSTTGSSTTTGMVSSSSVTDPFTTTATVTTTDLVTITRTSTVYGSPTTYVVICALNDVPCIGPAGVTTVVISVPEATTTSVVTKTCAVTDSACQTSQPSTTPSAGGSSGSGSPGSNGGSGNGGSGSTGPGNGSGGSGGSGSGGSGGNGSTGPGNGSGGSGGSCTCPQAGNGNSPAAGSGNGLADIAATVASATSSAGSAISTSKGGLVQYTGGAVSLTGLDSTFALTLGPMLVFLLQHYL